MAEINYINGYIVEMAKKLELACTMNYILVSLVKGKAKSNGLAQQMISRLLAPEEEEQCRPFFPFWEGKWDVRRSIYLFFALFCFLFCIICK